MSTSYTSLLGLALPVTGELSGTWGAMVDNAITSPLDIAVAGTQSITGDSNVTLSVTNGDTVGTNLAQVGSGSTGSAQYAIILCSGARTALRTITAPAASKIYTVINATTGGFSVKIVGAGPTTGLTIPNGSSAVIAWNGSDFIEIGSSTVGNFTVNGNLTVTGTSTLTGAVTNTAGTANGVAYLNGSKVLTTGTALVFDGTNLGVGVTNPSAYAKAAFQAASGAGALYAGTGTQGVFISADSSTRYVTYASTGSLSGGHIWNVGNSEVARIDLSGNLGIGTSSPGYKVDGQGASPAYFGLDASTGTRFGYASALPTNTINCFVGWIPDTVGTGGINGDLALQPRTSAGANIRFFTGSTSATERMRLDSSGNLGLGVTPSAWNSSVKALQVNNAALASFTSGTNVQTWLANNAYYDNATGWIYKNSSVGSSLYAQNFNGAHSWSIAPSGTAGNAITFTQAMTLDASGNLGIGTTTLLTKFTIQDTERLEFGGLSGVVFSQALNGARTTTVENRTYSSFTSWWTGASGSQAERMRLDTAGNLGLGVTPSAWKSGAKAFQLGATGYASLNEQANGSTSLNFNCYESAANTWTYVTGVAPTRYTQLSGAHAWFNAPSGTAGNAITFTQAMTLNASGNLAIGNTSPGTTLSIGSGATGGYGGGVYLNRGSSVYNFYEASDGTNTIIFGLDNNISNAKIGTVNSYPIGFYTGNTERMRLDSAGNLGLGVTPSAWGSSEKAIQVNNQGAFWSINSSNPNVWVSANTYFDNTNVRYINTAVATAYQQTNGQHVFYNAPSGTAGNAITFTQAMTLDADGNLAVGTSTASGKITAVVPNNASYQAAGVFSNATNADFIVNLKTNSTQIGPSTATPLAFAIGNSEVGRFDYSGFLLVGRTAVASGYASSGTFKANGSTFYGVTIANASATNTNYLAFLNNSDTAVGSVSQNGSAVLYNVTSDQRLKENIVDAAPASDLIDSLQVRQFDWKTDNTHQRYGFVAQELVTVAPEAVHQPADPEEMMAVDYSKLVPMLVKEIQDLRKRLAAAGI